MRTFALLLFLCFVLQASAQRLCTTQAYTETTRNTDPAVVTRMASVERFIKQQSQNFITGITGNASGENATQIIRIPVVVHLLYNTDVQNISDAQIKSGIAALNRDFRRLNWDTTNTPDRFKAAAADVEIEFHLATAAPDGAATSGIVRKQTSVAAFDMDDKIKFSVQGGDDGWDSKAYLNIWLGNTRRLLGYATMPGGDEGLDGVVINTTAFGTINTASPYHLGRTAVHEVGHWLGLYHIWGDAACGDDLVDDTPPQSGYTSGCPTGVRSSCNNDPAGDMFMNYMDFTNDACMNVFTEGQKDRMRALFAVGGPRYTLLTSTGLSKPWTETLPVPEDTTSKTLIFKLYPNPAVQELTLECMTARTWSGGELYLMNANGVLMEKIKITARKQKIVITHLRPGLYFLQGDVNGTKVMQKLIKL